MEVVIVADGGRRGAASSPTSSAACCARRSAPVLGLATGSSPLAAYDLLVDDRRAGRISFAGGQRRPARRVRRPAARPPEAYRTFIRRELIDHVDLPPARLYGPDVWAEDLAGACARYDRLLDELGGVDVQLLGIGSDGHIGFNEPGSSLGSRTRIKTLTEATRADNARFFPTVDEVPHHVVTQGLATIGEARHLVLVATGAAKAAPIARAVEGPLTAMCPASVLQLHPHATVVVDEAGRGRARSSPTTTGPSTPASRRGSSCERAAGELVRAGPTGGPGSMRLRLVNTGPTPLAGFQLAFTTVVQLTPTPPAAARQPDVGLPRRRSAARHAAGAGCDVWSSTLTCGHRPGHANDGPTGAYVVLADGATVPVQDGADGPRRRGRGRRAAPCGWRPPARLSQRRGRDGRASERRAAPGRRRRCCRATDGDDVDAVDRRDARRRGVHDRPSTAPGWRSTAGSPEALQWRSPRSPGSAARGESGRRATRRPTAGGACTSTWPGSSSRPPTSTG